MESYSACITVNQNHSFSLPISTGEHKRRHFHTETQRKAVSIQRKERFLIKCILLSCVLISVLCVSSILMVKASDKAGAPGQNKYYTSITVQENDTLWDLARQYNPGDVSRAMFIDEIKQMNNMTSDIIYSGQRLLIYYYSDIKK